MCLLSEHDHVIRWFVWTPKDPFSQVAQLSDEDIAAKYGGEKLEEGLSVLAKQSVGLQNKAWACKTKRGWGVT